MIEFTLVFGAGLLGILGHWWVRWAQGRTESTFMEYLMTNKASTIASIFSVLGSCSVVFSALPEDFTAKSLLLSVVGSFQSGYTLDSMVNRDKDEGQTS